MKTRLLQIWHVGVAALAVLVVSGCAQSAATNSPAAAVPPTNTPAATATVEADKSVVEISENAPPPEHAEPAPGSDTKPVPADLKLSPAANEIVKLAQRGVAGGVMLAFVTNSTGTFNLASDQIIYLNDLGVESDVITSMIEHDRLLREGGGALPPIASTAVPAAAAAPAAQTDAAAIAAAAAPQAIAQPATGEAPPPAATTEAVPAPPANVTYNYFYDSLSPYGTWIEVEGYGRCWQPSVVVLQSDWRPYRQGGRWIYTDYGWYWQSDYSWGWAPFHYGRWFSHPRWGWCWRPDTIWGPAWVSWRYTDAYCGWAPLPPAAIYSPGFGFTYFGSSVGWSFGFGLGWDCYAFVSWGHFRHHHPHRYCEPPHHAREIYRGSHVANHIRVGRDHRIINDGIGADRVRQFTKTDVRPVRVREEKMIGPNLRLTPGDRLERGGRELVVRRPSFPPTPAPAVAAKSSSNRIESRGGPTASLSDRRATPESRGDRAPGTVVPPGGKPEGMPSGRPAAPVGGVTRGELRDAVTARAASPRSPAPTQLAPESPKPVATVAPSTPSRTATPTARGDSAQPKNNVITFGRREPSPAAPVNAPNRIAPRPLENRSRANTTTTWTKPASPQPNVALNNAAPAAAPTFQAPAARAATRPATPTPSVRSESRWVAPAPSAPPTIIRPSSPPSYSPPVMRSAPSPAPAPSFTPRPAPSAPSAPSMAPAPRSAPAPAAPARSSGSGGGRSDGGRGNPRQR